MRFGGLGQPERITHAHQKHVFVGRDAGKFQACQINDLRAELEEGFWAVGKTGEGQH